MEAFFPLNMKCGRQFITYLLSMESKTFGSNDKPSTFTKTTTRKYFGAGDAGDMKKSSILFSSNPKEELYQGYSGLTSKANGYGTDLPKPVQQEEEMPATRTKSQTMYASMIVGKSDSYQGSSGLLGSNNVKELNDKADDLKKRLLEMASKKNTEKEDLVNKYTQPQASNTYPSQGPSPFSKSTKFSQNASYPSNDYTSKLENFLKQAKKQLEPPVPEPQSYTSQSPSSYTNYLAPPTTASFKKQTGSSSSASTSSYTDYTTNYSSPSSTNTYPSYSTNAQTAPKSDPKKMKKDDFQIGKKLGNGMFGEVFLVRHKTLRFVCAMKILQKEVVRVQKVEDQLVREIKIQFYLHHQNVVNLYGFFADADCVYLMQELCMDGHLFSMLKTKQRFEDPEAADIIRQICKGLDYIHREKIIHRDIKPQNIIMHQGVAKICDFGWGVYRGDGLRGTYCGTPLYTPPELLRGELYDEKFDIWAVGILAYQLIVGRFPFKIFCEDDIKRILTDQITFPFSVDVSPDAKNFILSIIRKDPRDRIELDEILNHPFLRKNSLKPVEVDFKL